MVQSHDTDLIVVTPEQIKKIRQVANVTQENIDEYVDILIEWYRQQPHLPKHDVDRRWVERLLLCNKLSIERSKNKMDMKFSASNLIPEFFTNMDPLLVSKTTQSLNYVMLPRLLNDVSRVFILRPTEKGSDDFNFENYMKYAFLVTQYRMVHDYFESEVFVYDMRYHTLGYFLKTNPSTMKRATSAVRKVFGSRVAAIHIINASPFVEKVLYYLTHMISPKLLQRVIIHSDSKGLHKYMPKDLIPRDYGGYERSCDELNDDWNNMFLRKDIVEWFKNEHSLKSEESKRPNKATSQSLYGIEGTFRSLNVD